jgi:hypothetical protein
MFPFHIPVSAVLSTTNSSLCYNYGPSDGDMPFNTPCRNSGSPTATSLPAKATPTRIATKIRRSTKDHDIPIYEPYKNCTIVSPEPLDLCDRKKLRHPALLDELFIKLSNMDLRSIRNYEIWVRHKVDGELYSKIRL